MSATPRHATTVPARGVRYRARDAVEARRMFAGGWSKAEISRRLNVSPSTVGRWVDPSVAKRTDVFSDQARGRRAARQGAAGLGRGHERPEFKLARMQVLRANGVKDAQIARLMAHDFGDVMSRDTVAAALDAGRYPKSLS